MWKGWGGSCFGIFLELATGRCFLLMQHRTFSIRSSRSWCLYKSTIPNDFHKWVEKNTWGFPSMGIPKMVGFKWTISLVWMINGVPPFMETPTVTNVFSIQVSRNAPTEILLPLSPRSRAQVAAHLHRRRKLQNAPGRRKFLMDSNRIIGR